MPLLLEDGKIALKANRFAAAYGIFMDLAKNEDQHAIMYLGDMLMKGQIIGDQLI